MRSALLAGLGYSLIFGALVTTVALRHALFVPAQPVLQESQAATPQDLEPTGGIRHLVSRTVRR